MDSKGFASLSSGLLARKGQAKPAMRPQGYSGVNGHEDLGWNDMGTGPAVPPAPIAVANPVMPPQAPPAVVRQQEALAREIEAPAAVAPAPAPTPVAQVKQPKARAAFTLRLDRERHLKLRLACAVDGRSAQLIVTQALDAYLATMPELATIAGTLPAPAKR